jgi:dethiobiotin synthetase
MNGLFVTGTGTGVGKTLTSRYICEMLLSQNEKSNVKTNVVYWKPIQCGELEQFDKVYSLGDRQWVSQGLDLPNYVSYFLKTPSSPHWAFEQEGLEFDVEYIRAEKKRLMAAHPDSFWVVEGAGGLNVPINEHWDLLDLILELDLEAVIVASPLLGTINHTRMSLQVAQNHGVKIKGFVFSQTEKGQNNDPYIQNCAEFIAHKSNIPFLGYVPYFENETYDSEMFAKRYIP